ncbi:MAG: hypothetical protein J6A77_06925 [Lachnospiraceae bacterium]|nr:hypothetical protein [Lachnospiraceae bacterium]
MSKSKRRKRKSGVLLLLLLLSLVAGYYVSAGMEPGFLVFDWTEKMQNTVLKAPFKNYWNQYSLPCMGVSFIVYLFICMNVLSVEKNYMHGKEYGTAKFMEADVLNKQLADLSTDIHDEKNIVLSQGRKWFGMKEYKIERM